MAGRSLTDANHAPAAPVGAFPHVRAAVNRSQAGARAATPQGDRGYAPAVASGRSAAGATAPTPPPRREAAAPSRAPYRPVDHQATGGARPASTVQLVAPACAYKTHQAAGDTAETAQLRPAITGVVGRRCHVAVRLGGGHPEGVDQSAACRCPDGPPDQPPDYDLGRVPALLSQVSAPHMERGTASRSPHRKVLQHTVTPRGRTRGCGGGAGCRGTPGCPARRRTDAPGTR